MARDAGDKREGPRTWRRGRKFPPPPQRGNREGGGMSLNFLQGVGPWEVLGSCAGGERRLFKIPSTWGNLCPTEG